MSREELVRVFTPFICKENENAEKWQKSREMITKVDFYMDKLTGADNSTNFRDRLAEHFGLPNGMSANALLEALNILTDKEGYKRAIEEIGE